MSKESDARKRALNGELKSKYKTNKACVARYQAKLDSVVTRIPKGEREKWKAYAAQNGTSLQRLIIGMMHEAMDKDGFDYSISEQSPEKSE